MIKKKTIETIEEFDQDGKLIKRTTTETTEEDDRPTYPINTPYVPDWTYRPNQIIYTGDPPPMRYDQVTCQQGATIPNGNTVVSAWACNQPDECENCGAGCSQ